MYLLLTFLLVSFVLGGTAAASHRSRKPLVVLGACAVVAMMFYSRRVL